MKILYITRKYPPSIGGMQRMNYHLIEALSKKAEVVKITWGSSQSFLPFFILYSYVKAVFILKKEFDVIILGDALLAGLGAALKKRFNIKTVSIVHGLDITFPLKAYQYFVLKNLKQLDRIICVSSRTREECLTKGLYNTTVIPNGINLSDSNTEAGTADVSKFGVNNKKILLTVGRLIQRKGVAEFISTVIKTLSKTRDDFVYVVIGNGSEMRRIRRAIEDSGLSGKVRIMGRCGDDTVKAFFRSAKIFVMPNIPVKGDLEGFGIVALEASSYGLPVVASRVDGIVDAVNDSKNGFLIPHDDKDLFVERISFLLDNESERLAISKSAREYAKEFSWDIIADRYLAVCKELPGAL